MSAYNLMQNTISQNLGPSSLLKIHAFKHHDEQKEIKIVMSLLYTDSL